MTLALLLALQAASPMPERIDILAPVPTVPCKRRTAPDEIVVCANPEPTQRLPLPGELGPPDGPRRLTGDPRAALDAGDRGACGLRGCQVGVDLAGAGVAAVRLVGKLIDPNSCCDQPGQATDPISLAKDLVGGARRVAAKKPDRSKRVPIPLDDPAPPSTQDMHP